MSLKTKNKNRKGQLTIDLLLAFLYLIVLVDALLIINNNYIKNQNEVLIRLQERRVAYIIAEMLNASNILSDGSTEIKFSVPGIRHVNKTMPMPCNISIGNNYIEVSTDVNGQTIAERIEIIKPTNVAITGSKCNSEFTIRYT
ncbi:MAG: hypothetical protein N3F05_00245 [Candidatus Diapherotrites archaeon]|nr:hypothetical protein [Candidatus Diapherotrites archaeon]